MSEGNMFYRFARLMIVALFFFSSGCSIFEKNGFVTLNVANAKKKVVSDYMLGLGPTHVFYSFVNEDSVLSVKIDNTGKTFPLTAEVVRFDDGSGEEVLNKWINNQHSDAMYLVREPVLRKALDPSCCAVLSSDESERILRSRLNEKVKYVVFDVELSIKQLSQKGQFKLEGFSDVLKVYVPETAVQ